MAVLHKLCRIAVFKSAHNWVSVSGGSCTVGGIVFHKVGPEIVKHHYLYLFILQRGTARSPYTPNNFSLIKCITCESCSIRALSTHPWWRLRCSTTTVYHITPTTSRLRYTIFRLSCWLITYKTPSCLPFNHLMT